MLSFKMLALKFLLLSTCLLLVNSHGVLQVLLLGGNGFIGSHVTSALLAHQNRLLNITIVSRGSWPFDTAKTIEPYTFHISCDRYSTNGLRGCSEFMNMVQHMAFDCVVDFSAYEPRVVQDALLILKERAGTYIFISSDSVYEVCEKSESPKLLEEDSIRPSDLKYRYQLASADSYGDEKLRGEDILKSQDIVPYIILRLPDVMGERDSTKRWWFYVMWLQMYESLQEPLQIPSHLETVSTSYVYAPDVANLIADIIFGRFSPEINNQIYNLGFDTGFTLKELLTEMASILNVQIAFEVKEKAVFMFPSVTRGEVDIGKAKQFFNFKPTDVGMALRKTVYFYKKAFDKFPKERDQIINKLKSLVIPENKLDAALKLIEKGFEVPLHTEL